MAQARLSYWVSFAWAGSPAVKQGQGSPGHWRTGGNVPANSVTYRRWGQRRMADTAQRWLGDPIRGRNGVKAHRMGSFRGGAVRPKADDDARPDERSGKPPKSSTKYLAMRVSSGRWQRTSSGSKADDWRKGGLTAKERMAPGCLRPALSGSWRFGEEAQARAVLEEVALVQPDRRWSAQERAAWSGAEPRHARWEWRAKRRKVVECFSKLEVPLQVVIRS
jgi:hypothetical protein